MCPVIRHSQTTRKVEIWLDRNDPFWVWIFQCAGPDIGCQLGITNTFLAFHHVFYFFCLRSSLILVHHILFQVKNHFIKFPEFPNWYSHCNTISFKLFFWRRSYLYFLTCNSNIILWLKSFKCNCSLCFN